jgi:hypothetical protein
MPTERKPVSRFVDKSRREWVVRDPEGHFWSLPSVKFP